MTREPLGHLEIAVLEVLWRAGAATVLEVYRDVCRSRNIQPNTVGSTLKRLTRKGHLTRTKTSRAFCYQPVLSHHEFVVARMRAALKEVGATVGSALIDAVVDILADEPGALDKLNALVAAKRGHQGEPSRSGSHQID